MARTLQNIRILIRRNREGIAIGALAGLATTIFVQQVFPEVIFSIIQTQSIIDGAITFVTGAAVGTAQLAVTKAGFFLILGGAVIGGVIDHLWRPLR